MPRHFTVEEANALLPAIIPKLEALRSIVQQLTSAQQELESINPAGRRNGQANRAMRLEATLLAQSRQAEEIVRELGDLGVEVKDPLTGLIDFRGRRSGRDVYLCWRLGEGKVAWWHELDGGFSGRRPL